MFPSGEWKERETNPAAVENLSAALEASGKVLPIQIAKMLAARGVMADTLDEFLVPSLSGLIDPCALPGVKDAVNVVLDAITAKKHIVIFGDYDTDGVCACAVLVRAISALGGKVDAFIPERLGEGYGLSEASIARMRKEYPDVELVVTVDNGVSAVEQIKELRKSSVKVVVTDHHLPGAVLPECEALVNPKVSSAPGCEWLCGAGVAFFLANALVGSAKERGLYSGEKIGAPLLVLAGIASVVDVMQLKGQNRIIVAAAVRTFAKSAPLGLRELFMADGVKPFDSVSARDFGFFVGPRLNAAGRVDSAMRAYELVSTENHEEARRLAVMVKGLNALRKGIENRMTEHALKACEKGVPAQVIYIPLKPGESDVNSDAHPGVMGIVAARVMEEVHQPVAVAMQMPSGLWHGSVRAPEGYNVHQALTECGEVLDNFGGHSIAAGFSVKEGAIGRFADCFRAAVAKQCRGSALPQIQWFDGWIEPATLSMEFAGQLAKLEPYGEGNPEPVFCLAQVRLRKVYRIGEEGKHLSMVFEDQRIPRAVWWRHGEDAAALNESISEPFDVMFRLSVSTYGTVRPHLELLIVDMRRAAV